MTTKFNILVLDSTGTLEVTTLAFGTADAGVTTPTLTVRVFNAEITRATTQTILNAMRADLLRLTPPGEELYNTESRGGELVTEKWMEVRKVGDTTWVPLDDYANSLDLGAIPAQDYVAVELRLVVPVDANTFGDVDFVLVLRSR
jgi:hypothetical protein